MIGVDCDGPACVVGQPGRALTFSGDFAFARGQATREADAAARGLFDAGAAEVTIWDNHGSGANLQFDRLDPRCRIVLGSGFPRRWPGLDADFAGVLMIGYHAMEGAEGAVLAHTYSPPAYRRITINGDAVGEIALDAAVAGALGVPVLLVASDDFGCREARRFLPKIETVETKRGLGRNAASSRHPTDAADAVYCAARRAAGRLAEFETFRPAEPVELAIHFKRPWQALKARLARPGWRLTGPMTLRRRPADLLEWSG